MTSSLATLHAVREGRAHEPALHAHAALAAVDLSFLDEERVGHGNPKNTGATDHRLATAKGSGAVIGIDAHDHLVTVAGRYGVDLVGLAAGDALDPCGTRARRSPHQVVDHFERRAELGVTPA